MSGTSPSGDLAPGQQGEWRPITAVEVIAHRVSRRRAFLVCAGMWALFAMLSAIASVSASAPAAARALFVATVVIILTMAGCAAVWRRRPIPSPKHLYPMLLPQTPPLGWTLFAVLTVGWCILCASSGAAGMSLPYSAMLFASVPMLIGSILLVPALVMNHRHQRLRDLVAHHDRARRALDDLADRWTEREDVRPFGSL